MKKIAAVLLVLMMVFSITGCNKKTGSAGQAGGKTELTLWLGSWWEGKAPGIKADFEAAYPQYTLTIDTLPINGYFDNAASAILAGSAPDILDIDVIQVSSFAYKNLIEDITDTVGAKLNRNDFIKVGWDASMYNGRLYGMPNRATGEVIFYNKGMFDAAGVAYPTDAWTYPDLLEKAVKITVPGQQYGYGFSADASDMASFFSSFAPVLWAFGGDFLSPDNKKAVINSAESVAGITFWAELYTKYKVAPEGTINYTVSRDVVPLLDQNKVAMCSFGVSGAQVFEANPSLKWDLVQPPSGSNRGGGWTFTLPVSSKHKEGAVDFMLWYAKPEVQYKHNVVEPAVIAAWDMGEPWNTPLYKQFMRSANSAKALPAVGVWNEIQNIVVPALQQVLLQQKTPQQAADEMAARINPLL
ncbi:hypothetical protein FACS1894130_13310 [Spirochaetia bacterium]|nr:hypothetical protein FACS1894130_13310 [Spirochaetia bacterium]